MKCTRIILFAFVFIIQGCATSYQKDGFTGGFSETQLSDRAWRVTFNGNTHTSKEQAYDFALLRAAELTISKGYSMFEVTSQYVGTNSQNIPMMPVPSGSGFSSGYAKGSNAVALALAKKKPTATLSIFMVNKESNLKDSVDALLVQKNLKKKYNID